MGVVTMTVGAGVVGGGDELWAHPAKKMQSMSVREIRGRKAFFMARDLYQYLLTFRSPVFPCFDNYSDAAIVANRYPRMLCQACEQISVSD